MRYGLVLVLALVATVASAQTDDPATGAKTDESVTNAQTDEPTTPPLEPKASFLFGAGNAFGWLGVQAEAYFAGGRASVFGGLGYLSDDSPLAGDGKGGYWSGVAVAAGVRGFFTPTERHRLFAEVSISQLGVEGPSEGDPPIPGDSTTYGPGVQVGYQYLNPGGFTFLVSVGVGYGVTGPEAMQGAHTMSGLAIGYTWFQ